MPAPPQPSDDRIAPWFLTACALSLAAAVSLGLARFAYGLLLPAMRADLGWSYFTAGAMNTVNAAGYLIGALCAPAVLARADARRVVMGGGALNALTIAAHGWVGSDAALYALRGASGVASAAGFIGGGLLAARLASRVAAGGSPGRSGLVLGLFYGGTGVGIVAASLGLPGILAEGPGAWGAGWVGLGALAAVATALTAWGTRGLGEPVATAAVRQPVRWRDFGFGLASYTLFGVGYIGYMTFVVTLLHERGWPAGWVTAFYSVLGLGVVASSWLWAGVLQRHRDGKALALLNALLAVATGLPVVSTHPAVVFASGALFGAVFLSVVASTTALVRHNAPAAAWPSGIAAFTIMFAAGQIVGPSLVGAIADGAGGLLPGLAVSAALLAMGAVLALAQRTLPAEQGQHAQA